MQQIRVQRKHRPSGRPGDAPAELLPTGPLSDTAKAADLIGRIDDLVASR